jgi:ketol-acid reductoisomerase
METQMAIIGFGNQAQAWALNLRDSGLDITIALRPKSPRLSNARNLGFKTIELGEGLNTFKYFALLIPDHEQLDFLAKHVQDLPQGARIIYAHGYSLGRFRLQDIYPQWSHLLLAPKSIAQQLRFNFETKQNLGAVYSIEHSLDTELDLNHIKSLAKFLGINLGPYPVNIDQETHADLFSEQAVLCSIIPYVANECFNLLRQKNYSPELAYLELWQEVKLITQAMIDSGPKAFFEKISPNALIGSEVGRKTLITKEFKARLAELLENIENGRFYKELDSQEHYQVKNYVSDYWKQQELNSLHDEMIKNK